MAKTCFLIVNPTSGTFSQATIEHIIATLRQHDLEPVLLATTSSMDPTLFATRICANVPDPLIVVAGGDGTVNGVLNGLTPGAATLAVIPTGTSNVLARELKIEGVDDALRRVLRGKTRQVPVGELTCAGQNRRFLLMAGVGVDGQVVRGVRLREKRRLGKGAYVLSALRVMRAWESDQLRVTGDGQSLFCHSVIVCNAAKYGGNFLLSPHGALFTPGFQVVCIQGGRPTYLKLFMLLALGRVAGSRGVTIFTANELEVAGGKAIQLDGDYFGCAPLRLKSIPDFLRMIV